MTWRAGGSIISREEDVPFDVIGISYYPFWHGSLAQLQYNLNDISARYDKDVIVVETAYAFTDQEDDFLSNIANQRDGDPWIPIYTRRSARHVEGCHVNCAGSGQWTRPRGLLLGCHLDSGAGEWMGLHGPTVRECLGKSSIIRFRRPGITSVGGIPASINNPCLISNLIRKNQVRLQVYTLPAIKLFAYLIMGTIKVK